MEESEVGSSSRLLLKRFKISKFAKFANAGGTTDILLCAKLILVKLYIVTIKGGKSLNPCNHINRTCIEENLHIPGISSKEDRPLSTKSNSGFFDSLASSMIFLIFVIFTDNTTNQATLTCYNNTTVTPKSHTSQHPNNMIHIRPQNQPTEPSPTAAKLQRRYQPTDPTTSMRVATRPKYPR